MPTLTQGSQPILSVLLAALWLAATGLLLTASTVDAALLRGLGQIAGLGFILALIALLWKPVGQRADWPAIQPIIGHPKGFLPTVFVVLVAFLLLFAAGPVVHPWLAVVTGLTIIAVLIMIRRRAQLTRRLWMLGLIAGATCLLLSWMGGRLDAFQAFHLACIPFLFIAGCLLVAQTGLARVHSADGNWGLALRAFAGASALAVPVALLNVGYGAHPGDVWVDRAWEPLVALVPGIAEETWARLFLLTLVYALLRPYAQRHPARAVAAAVLIAGCVHALAHLPGAMVFSPAAAPTLINAVVFGVPMGLLFVRYGFEAAVGYHFLIDFVRFAVAYLYG